MKCQGRRKHWPRSASGIEFVSHNVLTDSSQVLTGGFTPSLPLIIPLSSLLFLSTVLASMVGVIYFLVVPEMKN